jgi:hypothetical protein
MADVNGAQDMTGQRKWSVIAENLMYANSWGGSVGYNFDPYFMASVGISNGKLDSGTDDFFVGCFRFRYNIAAPRNAQGVFFQPFIATGYYYLSENHPFTYLGPSIRFAETQHDLSLELGGELMPGLDFIGTGWGIGYSVGPYYVLASSESYENAPAVTVINPWGVMSNLFLRCNF